MRFALLAITASLGGLLFGYDTGVVSGALLYVREVFHLSDTMQGLMTAIALGGAAVGALVAGGLADGLGRRIVILLAAALFMLGALASALAPALWVLLVGRAIIGVGIGIASMLTPLYLAELAPKERRGGVVTLNQTCITVGILVSYLVGYLFAYPGAGWRWMFGLGVVPGLLLGAGMLVLPESPRWLAGRGRTEDARRALRFARTGDVEAELQELRTGVAEEVRTALPWTVFRDPRARMPLLIGVGLAVLQQITGINTVIYFAPTILKAGIIHSSAMAILATAGIGAVNVAFTLVALWLLDRVGRRSMLLTGIVGMAACLCALAVAYVVAGPHGNPGIPAVVMIAAYVACFAIGLGPVFWLLIAEIFPLSVRGRGMAVCTVANWSANLVVTFVFLDVIRLIGPAGIFFAFAAICAVAFLFSARVVPETTGRSLEEIEADLAGGSPQRVQAHLAYGPRHGAV